MKPIQILQHLSQNSRTTGSYITTGLHKVTRIPVAPTDTDLQSHLKGDRLLGFNGHDANELTNWFAIDVDHPAKHKVAVTDFDGACNHIRTRLRELRLRYLEVPSRSGLGRHFYVLFNGRVPSSSLRDLSCAILPDMKIEFYPKITSDTPMAIFAPFFDNAGSRTENDEYDCMNDVNMVKQLVAQFAGRYYAYKNQAKTITPRRVSTKNNDTRMAPTLPVESTYTPKTDNEYRIKRHTVSQINGKERHGHDHSELTKVYSTKKIKITFRNSENPVKKEMTKSIPISDPVFHDEDFYANRFKLKYQVKGIQAFKSISELNRYFDRIVTQKGHNGRLQLNCTDYKNRSKKNGYDAFVRVELINRKQASIDIMMRDMADNTTAGWRCFTLPINNKKFVITQNDGDTVYFIRMLDWPTGNQKQSGRYNIQVGVKPTRTKPKVAIEEKPTSLHSRQGETKLT